MVEPETLIRYIRIFSELSSQIRYAAQKRILLEIGNYQALPSADGTGSCRHSWSVWMILEQKVGKRGICVDGATKLQQFRQQVSTQAPAAQAQEKTQLPESHSGGHVNRMIEQLAVGHCQRWGESPEQYLNQAVPTLWSGRRTAPGV